MTIQSQQRRSIWRRIGKVIAWTFRTIARLISWLFLLSFIISLGFMVWLFHDASRPPEVKPDTVLVMKFRGFIVDGPPMDITTQRLLGERVQTVQEIVQTLRKAAHDERIIGLLLKPGSYQMNLTAALDIREELLAFRQSGKKVFAYMNNVGMGGYLLTSVADQIFMPPSGSAFVSGFRAEVPFYSGLFEKIGVTPEFVAIGDYKTAPQVFTMDHMSDELREVLNEQLDTYYSAYVHNVAEARQVSLLQVQSWIDDALYTTQEALAAGMIDELVYESQLEERLAQELGLVDMKSEADAAPEDSGEGTVEMTPENSDAAPAGDSGEDTVEVMSEDADATTTEDENESPLTTLSASQYAHVEVDAPDLHITGEKIAVVYASGIITSGNSSPSASQPSIGSDSMTELLASLTDDDEIQGIILRIDSGGGGIMASDFIRNSVQEATDEKPVIVTMADVAASGGYMIAIPANRIIAHPLTLTGSIGIFGGKFSLEGLSDLLGVRIETLQRGQNAGLFTAFRTHTPEEQERFRTYLQQHYDEFVAQVAQGRQMTMTTADEIAQGRVWVGTQAAELGLVDALGGLETAITMMKEMLEIPEEEDVTLEPYPRPGNPFEVLRQRFGGFLRQRFGGLVQSQMSKEVDTMNQRLEELVRLQNEHVFAWWPGRIRLD